MWFSGLVFGQYVFPKLFLVISVRLVN